MNSNNTISDVYACIHTMKYMTINSMSIKLYASVFMYDYNSEDIYNN
jgi:hypothetical protein